MCYWMLSSCPIRKFYRWLFQKCIKLELWADYDNFPWKLTWKPIMQVWKLMLMFKRMIFRFHANFLGCNPPTYDLPRALAGPLPCRWRKKVHGLCQGLQDSVWNMPLPEGEDVIPLKGKMEPKTSPYWKWRASTSIFEVPDVNFPGCTWCIKMGCGAKWKS